MTVTQDSQALSAPRGGDNGFMDSQDDGGQARPRRRTYGAEHKLATLEAYDGSDAPGPNTAEQATNARFTARAASLRNAPRRRRTTRSR